MVLLHHGFLSGDWLSGKSADAPAFYDLSVGGNLLGKTCAKSCAASTSDNTWAWAGGRAVCRRAVDVQRSPNVWRKRQAELLVARKQNSFLPLAGSATPRFDRRQQTTAVMANARMYFEILTYKSQLIFLAGFLILLYVGRQKWWQELLNEWGLLMPSIAAFALYLPVHVEARYVAPFICAFWLGLFSSLNLHDRKDQGSVISEPGKLNSRKKLIACVMVAAVSLVMLAVIMRSTDAFYNSITKMVGRSDTSVDLQVADALRRNGVQNGDRVGLINFDTRWLPIVHWARLARVRVVAELPNTDSDKFAAADDSHRREVIDTFAKTGAKILVAAHVPMNVTLRDWEQIGQTDYYVLKFSQP